MQILPFIFIVYNVSFNCKYLIMYSNVDSPTFHNLYFLAHSWRVPQTGQKEQIQVLHRKAGKWKRGYLQGENHEGRAFRHTDNHRVSAVSPWSPGPVPLYRGLGLVVTGYFLSLAAEMMWHILARGGVWGHQARWYSFS